ncbi:MAG: hypothetical protein LC804_28180, partial [Acidobacteria bacterium]|nr:hypothetical protein [Acidobacteriota bacterium]
RRSHRTRRRTMALTAREQDRLLELGPKIARHQGYKFHQYFRATGPTRRSLYPKHLKFFRAGATYKERLFMARPGWVAQAANDKHRTRQATIRETGWPWLNAVPSLHRPDHPSPMRRGVRIGDANHPAGESPRFPHRPEERQTRDGRVFVKREVGPGALVVLDVARKTRRRPVSVHTMM